MYVLNFLTSSTGTDTAKEPRRVFILATENIPLTFVFQCSEVNLLSNIIQDIETSLNSFMIKCLSKRFPINNTKYVY